MGLPAYFAGLSNTGQPLADIRRFLSARRPDTLRHVARVAAVGRRLARRFQLPRDQSDLACFAHDLAAVVPLRAIVATADGLGLALTEADRAIPPVLHGPVAAAVLRQVLGVGDPAVLAAVAYHTTLRAGAGPLEQLVFVADKLAYDPTTTATGYHARLLAASDNADLPVLCWLYLDWAVQTGPRLGWRLHPHLVAAEAALRPTRIRP